MFETACILLAGGSGQRFGGDQPKQFARIAGKTVLEHSLSALREHMPGCLIVVTAPLGGSEAPARRRRTPHREEPGTTGAVRTPRGFAASVRSA